MGGGRRKEAESAACVVLLSKQKRRVLPGSKGCSAAAACVYHRDAKDKAIRRAVVTLLPRVAAFSAERFAVECLPKALGHLLSVLKVQQVSAAYPLDLYLNKVP